MNRITLILATLMLAACSSGGNDGGPPPVVDIPLDGVYRASPPIVSANGLAFDYEDPTPGAWQQLGSVGRVYTTTVRGNDVSGTATMYVNGVKENSALTGTITAQGAMSLNFTNNGQNVNVQSQRLAEAAIEPTGRAWCINEFDNVTVHSCGEFDVLNSLSFSSPGHDTVNDLLHLKLGEQVEANVYEASLDWEVCGTMSGVVGFSESEDGTQYEMAVNVVNGSCGYQWFQLTTVR